MMVMVAQPMAILKGKATLGFLSVFGDKFTHCSGSHEHDLCRGQFCSEMAACSQLLWIKSSRLKLKRLKSNGLKVKEAVKAPFLWCV